MQVELQRRRLAVLLVVPRLLQHWHASRKSRATAARGGGVSEAAGGLSFVLGLRGCARAWTRGVRVGGVPGMPRRRDSGALRGVLPRKSRPR